MIDLNSIKKITLEIYYKRLKNGAPLGKDHLKHCAGEVTEAVIARENLLSGEVECLASNLQNLAQELADIIICVLNEAAETHIDIERAILDVIAKNEKRALNLGDKL